MKCKTCGAPLNLAPDGDPRYEPPTPHLTRIPAETFPPGEFIKNELNKRGWSTVELAKRMGGSAVLNLCNIGLLIEAPDKGMILDKDTSARLGRALGVSADFFTNLDCAWRALVRAG